MEIVEQKPLTEKPLVNTPKRKRCKKTLVIGIFVILFLLFIFITYLFIADIISEFFFTDQVKPTELIIDSNSYSETNNQDKGKGLKSNENIDIKSIPEEIIKSNILLQTSDKKLYSTLPLNGEKILILDSVYSYAVSNNKSKIAYIKSYGTEEDTFFIF